MDLKIEIIIKKALENKIFPGCVVGYISGQEKNVLAFGNLRYTSDANAVNKDTIYDVASITKSIPTAMLAIYLIDKGKLSLNDKAIKYLPKLSGRYANEITVFHLLAHTVIYPFRMSDFKHLSATQILEHIYAQDLSIMPGIHYSYSNVSSLLLSLIIEKCTSKNLDELSTETFFTPLKMMHTYFKVPPEKYLNTAPSEINTFTKKEILGVVHDESANILQKITTPGSAGLFSSVPDLLIFLEMLMNKSSIRSTYFTDAIIATIYKNQLANINCKTGLGFEIKDGWRVGSIGKTGFTGCHFVLNIAENTAMVLLSNFTYPARRQNRDLLDNVRKELNDLLFK